MNNFKVLFNIGDAHVKNITDEIELHNDLWNQVPIRTKIANSPFADHYDDILLQYNNVTILQDSLENNIPIDELETISYPPMFILKHSRDFIFTLMSIKKGDRLGRALISKLQPGAHINAHADSPTFSYYYNRYHLCLKDNNDTIFRCGNEYFTPNVGDVFQFDNSLEHEIWNDGTAERWTLVVDIKKPVLFTGEYQHRDLVVNKNEQGDLVVQAVDNTQDSLYLGESTLVSIESNASIAIDNKEVK